jgi:riboflavin synthase
MFTGIVSEIGRVDSIQPDRLVVQALDALKGLALGNSVAVNGVCLTVTAFAASTFEVGLAPETIRRSNLSDLAVGAYVNLERPLGLGGELGGHLVQGHVDDTGILAALAPEGEATLMSVKAPAGVMTYAVEKGFIAVEGISLTIASLGTSDFQVSVVDYTKNHTNLKYHKIGDRLNLEIDILAKYVRRFTEARNSKITMEYLREQGF